MKYKTVSSIGSWCQCAHQLRRQNLNVVSTPFDWAFVSMDSIIHLITTDFASYFRKENLSPDPEGRNVVDHDSGINIAHYFGRDLNDQVTASIIERDYSSLREAFLRRADRMRNLLRSSGPHLYVWLTDKNWHEGRSARQASHEFLSLIRKHYPLHEADLLTVQFEREREPEWEEPNIFNRYVPLTEEGWIGDNGAWDEIMQEFSVAIPERSQGSTI